MILNRLLVAAALLLVAAFAQAQEPVAQPPLVEEALTPATDQSLPDGVAFPATRFGTFMSSSQFTFVIVNAPPFRFTGHVDMDGRGGAFFADEIDDDTALGSDDGIFAWAATYVGVFAGFGQADNRIVDVDGFANWGNPGSTVDYDTSGFIGGALIGKKFKIGGVPLRIELDGMVGKVSATSNRLDPEGLDETVQSACCQIATARAGIEQPVGAATIFAAGGLAAARIEHSVTDIDFGPNMPPRMDPDDFNADPDRVAHADRTSGVSELQDWLGGSYSVEFTEDVVGLGGYGRTLTILAARSAVDVDELQENEELVESWRPRFRR